MPKVLKATLDNDKSTPEWIEYVVSGELDGHIWKMPIRINTKITYTEDLQVICPEDVNIEKLIAALSYLRSKQHIIVSLLKGTL